MSRDAEHNAGDRHETREVLASGTVDGEAAVKVGCSCGETHIEVLR